MEISTQLSLNIFVEYYLYTQKKYIRLFRIFGIIAILLGVSDIISCFFDEELIMDDLMVDIVFAVLMCGIGLLFIFGMKKLLVVGANKQYKSNMLYSSNPVITYQFNENNLKVLTTSPLSLEDCIYSYKMLTYFAETDSSLYIFNGNASAFIITKTNENISDINKIVTYLRDEVKLPYVKDMSNKQI